MTKGYVCVECGSQIVGHSKADCDAGKAHLLFENWWNDHGRFLDPDIVGVSWFDKRKELAGLAYVAGRMSVPKWTPFVGQPVPQPERHLEESREYAQHLRVEREELRRALTLLVEACHKRDAGDPLWNEAVENAEKLLGQS